jgi:subtilisin-like proprotein convertase family protein
MNSTHTPRLKWLTALALAVVLVACPTDPKPPPVDTTPNAVTFAPVNDANLSAIVESNQVTISGINTTVPVSVTGGEYKIGDAGAYTSTPGTISAGGKVQLRTTSANALNTAKDVNLTVGTSAFTFTVTTKKTTGDVSFASKIDQPWATTVESNTVTLSGLNPSTPVSVSGGSYKVNAGAYTTAAGTVKDGDTISVKGSTASADLTDTVVTLTIGSGASAQARTFTITTGKRIPDDFTLPAAIDQDPGATVTRAISFSSPSITIPTPVSIAGGTFTVNGAPGANGVFINPGDAIVVSGTAPATADGSSQNVVLTVGGKSATLTITTKNQNPAINFTAQTGVAPNISVSEKYWTGTTRCTIYPPAPNTDCPGLSGDPRYQQPPLPPTPTFTESNTVTLGSISANTPISIVGGEYSVNGAAYTNTTGTLNPGDTLRVRLSAIFPGALHKAALTFGANGGGTSSFTKEFNVTTSSTAIQNVWTPNAVTTPITIPTGGTASSTISVPTTTAKIAKVRVLVTLSSNDLKRSVHIIKLVPPSGTGVSALALMDFVTPKAAGNGLSAGKNPLDPRNGGGVQPATVTVPLATGAQQQLPWPWNTLPFFDGGWGGPIDTLFDSSKFGTDGTQNTYIGDWRIGIGTDTYLDGGINRNDVYRRCGTDFYLVNKGQYTTAQLLTGTDVDALNTSLNRDLPRNIGRLPENDPGVKIDPYTGIPDNRVKLDGEYTEGQCKRQDGNTFYPPVAPDPRVGNLTALNTKNPSGAWTLEVQQTEPGSSPISITAFKLIFDFAP